MEIVATLHKPPGFYDPSNPAALPLDADEADEECDDAEEGDDAEECDDDDDEDARPSFLSFSNTDMAFTGDVLVAGSYHGFNAYRLLDANDALVVGWLRNGVAVNALAFLGKPFDVICTIGDFTA